MLFWTMILAMIFLFQFYNLEIPMTTDDWFFNAFSISKDNGIGLLGEPIPFSSIR